MTNRPQLYNFVVGLAVGPDIREMHWSGVWGGRNPKKSDIARFSLPAARLQQSCKKLKK
jgi:hypothetical protein